MNELQTAFIKLIQSIDAVLNEYELKTHKEDSCQ